jgi:hypothetical protein
LEDYFVTLLVVATIFVILFQFYFKNFITNWPFREPFFKIANSVKSVNWEKPAKNVHAAKTLALKRTGQKIDERGNIGGDIASFKSKSI